MNELNTRWAVAILAAGKGSRMRSELPKVMHELAGRPLLDHVIDRALDVARPQDIVVVVGHGAGEVGSSARDRGVNEVLQEPQLGTGDALRVALDGLDRRPTDHVLVLSGDVPLLRPGTLQSLMTAVSDGASAALLTAVLDTPGSYGRVLRSEDGLVCEVVEARDADQEQLAIQEVNAGIYGFDRPAVTTAVAGLNTDNAQGEYYLTDVVAALRTEGRRVAAVQLEDPEEMQGVNTRADLARAEHVLNHRVLDGLMDAGVTIRDPGTIWVDPRSEIGPEVVLEPGVVLRGYCHVAAAAVIGAGCVLDSAAVGPGEKVPPLTYLTGE